MVLDSQWQKVLLRRAAKVSLNRREEADVVLMLRPVYTLDRADKPSEHWEEAKRRVKPEWGGELHYVQVDVSHTEEMSQVINTIAESNQRLDGLMAAAAIQQVTPALEWNPNQNPIMGAC